MNKILLVGNILSGGKVNSILARFNCSVLQAGSNDEAYSIHSKEKVSLIITTLDLPGMEAEELCMRLRWSPELKFVSILIACDDNHSDIERCRGMKANGYITLPIDESELEERLVSVISVPKRKPYKVVASVKSSKRVLFCNTVNVSTSGILMESSDKLDQGASIELSFYLPGSKRFECSGEVIRVLSKSNMFFYGVRFDALEPDMQLGLKSFVDI